jgi:hypothetical protein
VSASECARSPRIWRRRLPSRGAHLAIRMSGTLAASSGVAKRSNASFASGSSGPSRYLDERLEKSPARSSRRRVQRSGHRPFPPPGASSLPAVSVVPCSAASQVSVHTEVVPVRAVSGLSAPCFCSVGRAAIELSTGPGP